MTPKKNYEKLKLQLVTAQQKDNYNGFKVTIVLKKNIMSIYQY